MSGGPQVDPVRCTFRQYVPPAFIRRSCPRRDHRASGQFGAPGRTTPPALATWLPREAPASVHDVHRYASKTRHGAHDGSQTFALTGRCSGGCVPALRHGAGRSCERTARRTQNPRCRTEHGRAGPLLASLLASSRPLALPPLVPLAPLVVAGDCQRLRCEPALRLWLLTQPARGRFSFFEANYSRELSGLSAYLEPNRSSYHLIGASRGRPLRPPACTSVSRDSPRVRGRQGPGHEPFP